MIAGHRVLTLAERPVDDEYLGVEPTGRARVAGALGGTVAARRLLQCGGHASGLPWKTGRPVPFFAASHASSMAWSNTASAWKSS